MNSTWYEEAKAKTIMIVGPSPPSKIFPFEIARKLNLSVVVAHWENSWAQKYADEWVVVEKEVQVEAQAEGVVRQVKEKNLKIHGVFTWAEVPCANLIASGLGINPNNKHAYEAARDKSTLRARMREAGLPTPDFFVIKEVKDLDNAKQSVRFPAVLKPVDRAGAFAVIKVESPQALDAVYQTAIGMINGNEVPWWAQMGGSDKFVLETYLDGQEVDVDMLVYNSKLVFASISDNATGSSDFLFQETWNLPSTLPVSKQSELVKLCFSTLLALGFNNGAFHVEAKYTSNIGPQIVEVNARIGGVYVYKDVKSVWGVDMFEQAMLIALHSSLLSTSNVSPPVTLFPQPILGERDDQIPSPKVHISGRFLYCKKSGTIESIEPLLKFKDHPSVHNVTSTKETPCDLQYPPTSFDDHYGTIETWGDSFEDAEKKMAQVLLDLGDLISTK